MSRLLCSFGIASALLNAGCATIAPKSSAALADAGAEHVEEFRHVVQLPLPAVYRNVLAKARECWQQTGGWPFPKTYFVEADPFDASLGYARISMRIESLVPTVVTITPQTPGTTLVLARRMKMVGVYYPSHNDLPNLHTWAIGAPSPCKDKLLL